MSLHGPNAVEIEKDARVVTYVCPLDSCRSTKQYLVQGKSGALPPRCWENDGNGERHPVELMSVAISVPFDEPLPWR